MMKQRVGSTRSHWIRIAIFGVCVVHSLVPASARSASHSDAAARARLAQQYPRCDGSTSQKSENVPVNTSDAAHEIAHAFSIAIGDKVVAWVYTDADNSMWFEGKTTVNPVDVDLVARAFGIFDILTLPSRNFAVKITGQIYPSTFKGGRLIIHGCF